MFYETTSSYIDKYAQHVGAALISNFINRFQFKLCIHINMNIHCLRHLCIHYPCPILFSRLSIHAVVKSFCSSLAVSSRKWEYLFCYIFCSLFEISVPIGSSSHCKCTWWFQHKRTYADDINYTFHFIYVNGVRSLYFFWQQQNVSSALPLMLLLFHLYFCSDWMWWSVSMNRYHACCTEKRLCHRQENSSLSLLPKMYDQFHLI